VGATPTAEKIRAAEQESGYLIYYFYSNRNQVSTIPPLLPFATRSNFFHTVSNSLDPQREDSRTGWAVIIDMILLVLLGVLE
jgi:hypothetical protein